MTTTSGGSGADGLRGETPSPRPALNRSRRSAGSRCAVGGTKRIGGRELPEKSRDLPAGVFLAGARPGNRSGGIHAHSCAGCAVAAIGDLDDDGHQDLALGTPGMDNGATLEAGAFRILFLDECDTVRSEVVIQWP